MIKKLLQPFVILWVWINYENRHSDALGHLLFSLPELKCTLSDYVSVLLKKKKSFFNTSITNLFTVESYLRVSVKTEV